MATNNANFQMNEKAFFFSGQQVLSGAHCEKEIIAASFRDIHFRSSGRADESHFDVVCLSMTSIGCFYNHRKRHNFRCD